MPTTGKSRGEAAVSVAASPAALLAGWAAGAAVVLRVADPRADGLLAAGLRLLVVIRAPDRREMTAA